MDDLYLSYKQRSPTLNRFHSSTAFYRGIRGAIRSGKSYAVCNEIFRRSMEQKPHNNGIRYTRWGVIRQTYQELKDTTVATWLRIFPEAYFGKFNYQSMTHRIRMKGLDIEMLFRAIDRPDEVRKLLSLELTGGWVNEARETHKTIIDALGDRVGQYPPKDMGGCTWRGVILDTNSMSTSHWWYDLAEKKKKQGELPDWEFFDQPPAVLEVDGKFHQNPNADNIYNLNEPNYYELRLQGKDPDYIRVYYGNQYGFVRDGLPVFPEYVDSTHCSKEVLRPVAGVPIRSGIDWGLTPAATFGQRLASGRWIILNELVATRMGAQAFGHEFAQFVKENYPGFTLANPTGDPAGSADSQTDERTCFELFNASLKEEGIYGIEAEPAPSNDPELRQGAIRKYLKMLVDGIPAFLISPACTVLREGMMGGYHFAKKQLSGEAQYKEVPAKDRYSHCADSCQYLFGGAGEGQALIEVYQPEDLAEFLYSPGEGTGWG